ncbi:MAG: hypothetical protein ACETWD_03855 [Desulfatiglandales bacterium]|jgi:hypothetical protein
MFVKSINYSKKLDILLILMLENVRLHLIEKEFKIDPKHSMDKRLSADPEYALFNKVE